jgi:hypothetical protein
MARNHSSGRGALPPPHENSTAETVMADYNSLTSFDKDRVHRWFRVIHAEGVIRFIRTLSKRERQRVGMLLARNDYLPGWRVVQASSVRPTSIDELPTDQARLFNYLEEMGENYCRPERAVIRHLWPAEPKYSPDPARYRLLRDRLRQLQWRTNRNIEPLGYKITRPSKGKELCLVRE